MEYHLNAGNWCWKGDMGWEGIRFWKVGWLIGDVGLLVANWFILGAFVFLFLLLPNDKLSISIFKSFHVEPTLTALCELL